MTTTEHIGHDPIESELLELLEAEEIGTLSSAARTLTKGLLSEGHERDELLDAYESVIEHLYGIGHDDQAEELLEVMAELEGFCSPHARL